MKDREDEEEIQQNFCFVLAEELEKDGIISYHAKRLLLQNEFVLPLFSARDSTACLMVHLVRQEHGVKETDDNTEVVEDVDGGELSTKAMSQEEIEWERELAAVEGRARWRQQKTVIIYECDGRTPEEVNLDEEVVVAMETENTYPIVPST